MAEIATDEIALVQTGGDLVEGQPVQVIVRKTKISKPKLSMKYHRTPFAFYQVLALGALLLLLILACVAIETLRNTSKIDDLSSLHSNKEMEYHKGIVHLINYQNLSWKARYNRFASQAEGSTGVAVDSEMGRFILENFALEGQQLLQDTRSHVEGLMRFDAVVSSINSIKIFVIRIIELFKTNLEIPTNFDVRLQWPQCWSVHQVFNQAGCGSCWWLFQSVAATSVMSDRVCISSNGSQQIQISALDLTSCCRSCGGCQGTHWALSAFTYWKKYGIVSGGAFGSHEGCRPYAMEPNCGNPCAASLYLKERTPICQKTCQPLYNRKYQEDIVKSGSAYWLRAVNGSSEYTPIVKSTLEEIVQGKFTEYFFLNVKSDLPELMFLTGIYTTDETRSQQLYGHCAKLLGWGNDAGRRYWLYSNTWGREWGEYDIFAMAKPS
uniref:Pept_C1 domain-containing protein n=1 Tax=Heterorhabditis bacteriophora TaxID=37862 RepID=A0A1I7WY57_HETBA